MRHIDYSTYLKHVQNNVISNPKYFWKFFNDKKPKNHLPNLMQFNDKEASNGLSIVDMFNEYFSSLYTSPLTNPNYKHNFPSSIPNIYNIDISLMDIFNELDNLNINLYPGPDNISPKFLYNCRFILSYPIHYLFKQSLSSGTFPSFFKIVFISTLFKKGDRSSVLNYRPISKISIIPKIFTKLINDKLTNYSL